MTCLGAIAQLGERRHGMAEVEGSSPSSSTILKTVETPRSLVRGPGLRRPGAGQSGSGG
jgi:hypothetical protein